MINQPSNRNSNRDSENYSYLDKIRINQGSEKCKYAIQILMKENVKQAANLLNDEKLMFPCLYILYDIIRHQQIERYLDKRNLVALSVIDRVKSMENMADILSVKQDSVYSALMWIVKTGHSDEIQEDDYEEAMELSISILINVYRETDIIPVAVDLVFSRNRNNRFIHDLVWMLFRSNNPQVLALIAQYLRSKNPKDVVLSAELLNINHVNNISISNNEKYYNDYLNWLNENQPYLYFTEESFQYASNPAFFDVDLARKYLQKATPTYKKLAANLSDDIENENIQVFNQLSNNDKSALSDYSHKMHSDNLSEWQEWLRKPISEQIKLVKGRREEK